MRRTEEKAVELAMEGRRVGADVGSCFLFFWGLCAVLLSCLSLWALAHSLLGVAFRLWPVRFCAVFARRWDRCFRWVGQPSVVLYVCGSIVAHGSISDVLEEHVIGVLVYCAYGGAG